MSLREKLKAVLTESEQATVEAALEELTEGHRDGRQWFRVTQLRNVLCDRPQEPATLEEP